MTSTTAAAKKNGTDLPTKFIGSALGSIYNTDFNLFYFEEEFLKPTGFFEQRASIE